MNIHYGNQSQFELFPRTTGGDPIENTAPRFIFSRVVLSFENVVVIFVLMIVSLIIAFSAGVEKGRRFTRLATPVAQIAAPVAAVNSVAPRLQAINAPSPLSAGRIPAATASVAEAAHEVITPQAPLAPVLSRPAPPQKVIDKGYTVQVASYKLGAMADKEAGDLKRQGFESFVAKKGSFAIVCVGKFASAELARQMQNKLKKRYKDSMIRSF